MIEISSDALADLARQLEAEGGPHSAIRIAVMGDAGLGLLVDEKRDDDELIEINGLAIIINRGLLAYCRTIQIERITGDAKTGCAGKNGGYRIVAEQPVIF